MDDLFGLNLISHVALARTEKHKEAIKNHITRSSLTHGVGTLHAKLSWNRCTDFKHLV